MLAVKLSHSWHDIADRISHLSVELAGLFQDTIWAIFVKQICGLYNVSKMHITVNKISIFDKT